MIRMNDKLDHKSASVQVHLQRFPNSQACTMTHCKLLCKDNAALHIVSSTTEGIYRALSYTHWLVKIFIIFIK